MASGQDPLITLLGGLNQQPQQTPMQPQQGVLPPTNPVQAQPQGGPDVTALMQQMAQKYQMPAMQGEMNVANSMGPLSAPDAIPKQGLAQEPWMKMQPMTGQGFGHDVGNVLGDVGKALLLGLASTGPGRVVQEAHYGPAKEAYEAGRKQKAERMEAMKAQAGAYGQVSGSASQAIGGLAEADYRNRMAGSRERQTDINQQKADQDGQRIAQNYAIQGQRLAQGWDRLDQGQQNIAIKQWFDKGVLQAMNARIDAGMDQNNARIQAQEDMRAAATQSGFAMKYPILGKILGAVGMDPDLTSAPAAGVPKPVTQSPRRAGQSATGAVVPKGTIVYSPQGKAHTADGTHPLPQGWSTKKP